MKNTILSLAVTAVALAGCAHQQKQTTEETPPPAKAAVALEKKTAAPKPVDAADPNGSDLDAILNGLVVHFEFDRSELTEQSRKRLDKLAEAMRKAQSTKILIAGNADELGTEEYNLALGQRRADAVRSYLITLGVDGKQVDTVTYGEEKPVANGSTPDAHQANRRADVEKTTKN